MLRRVWAALHFFIASGGRHAAGGFRPRRANNWQEKASTGELRWRHKASLRPLGRAALATVGPTGAEAVNEQGGAQLLAFSVIVALATLTLTILGVIALRLAAAWVLT